MSVAWREATETMQRSYSHSGYPYDNACIESFHSLIKREWLNRFNIINFKHTYRLVFEYIETFYNTVRIIVTATICLLTTLKNCMRGNVLCRQLSWQNFSFYFVLNLDTGPEDSLRGQCFTAAPNARKFPLFLIHQIVRHINILTDWIIIMKNRIV